MFPCEFFSHHLLPVTRDILHTCCHSKTVKDPASAQSREAPRMPGKAASPGHVASVLPCHRPPSSRLHITTASLLHSLLTPKSMEIFTVKKFNCLPLATLKYSCVIFSQVVSLPTFYKLFKCEKKALAVVPVDRTSILHRKRRLGWHLPSSNCPIRRTCSGWSLHLLEAKPV